MNNLLGLNIKNLRRSHGLTQDQLADKIGVNRAMIGSYEEGRAVPKLPVLRTLAYYFDVSIDDLVNLDLNDVETEKNSRRVADIEGKGLRVLTTLVDRDNKELITLVPVKASAGYLKGYSDPDFMETLPRFGLPVSELGNERSYRAFQITGDSMLPVLPDSYIICEYVRDWHEIKDGKTYVLITQDDGVVYKRLFSKDENTLIMKSDNPEYAPYTISVDIVSEVWKALGYISFSLPEPDEMSLGKLTALVYKMQNEMDELKKGRH